MAVICCFLVRVFDYLWNYYFVYQKPISQSFVKLTVLFLLDSFHILARIFSKTNTGSEVQNCLQILRKKSEFVFVCFDLYYEHELSSSPGMCASLNLKDEKTILKLFLMNAVLQLSVLFFFHNL